MQIHIGRDGQRLGPYSLEEVRSQLAAGTLHDSDLAWYEGAANWMPLSTVPGLSAAPGAEGPGVPPAAPTPFATAGSSTSITPAVSGNYAGFWIRVAAYLIDLAVLIIPIMIIQSLFKGAADDPSTGHPYLAMLLTFVFETAYFAGLWSSTMQATVGQKVCGLRVINSADGSRLSIGRGVLRVLGLFVASLILGIGLLMVAFTERKQGLHDMIAGTYVVKAR